MQKRGCYPKYLSNAKEAIHAEREKTERTIFNDIIAFIKNGAPYRTILDYLESNYELFFSDEKNGIRYIRNLVNRYQPNCILCNEKRINMRGQGLSLFCESHNERIIARENESYLKEMNELIEKPIEKCPELDGIVDIHNDIYDKAEGVRRGLGTTNFSPHRLEDFNAEQKYIDNEFKVLGLKHEKKSK